MKLKNILFLSLFFIVVPAICATTNSTNNALITEYPNDDIIIHTVKKGENVYSISTAYNVSVDEIYRLNPKAEKGIKEGEKLKIPKARKATGYSNHLIEAKETLYSVSRMYRITVDDLKRANPGLDETNFYIGKTIRIPKFGIITEATADRQESYAYTPGIEAKYKVRKGDTLYSIGKANNVTVEALLGENPALAGNGLKEGMTITIPAAKIQVTEAPAQATEVIQTAFPTPLTDTPYASKGDVVRIGVVLSFLDAKATVQQNKIAEYYEGFLLAVKEMKSKGLNAEIYTFDIDTEKDTDKLKSLLETNEFKNLHLIIGGTSKEQIDILTKFAKETGTKYVIPFGTTKGSNTNTEIFQMTSTHSNLYPEISSAFIKRFGEYNIIFVNEIGSNKNKLDFVDELKKELTGANIQFKTTSVSNSLYNEINAAASSSSRKNILIPTSSSEATLKKILTTISPIKSESITLFGYPEWQTYSSLASGLHKYNSFIYSIFFADEKQPEVKEFADEYRKWYNTNMVNSFPKYGLLGYDTGLFFLTALNKYGSNFSNNIREIDVHTLQSAIGFEQGSDGLFINKGLYFINFKTDSGIEKIDVFN